MKLIILISIAVLASCDYPAPADTYGPPADEPPADNAEEPSLLKVHFNYPSFRHYPSYASLFSPYSTFTSRYPYNYRYKPLSLSRPSPNFHGSNFGALPPLLDVFPPASSIIPPIFGSGLNPQLPINPQIIPPNILPPSIFPKPPTIPILPQVSDFSFPFSSFRSSYPYSSLYRDYYSKTPFTFPLTSFGSITETSFSKKGYVKNQKPSNSYGPPEENSTENAQQSDETYPYEAASETGSDTADEAPHKPAAEYGPPSKK